MLFSSIVVSDTAKLLTDLIIEHFHSNGPSFCREFTPCQVHTFSGPYYKEGHIVVYKKVLTIFK